ncbi:hypothetical protein ABT369_11825 [Dactylosporangium sp. NPDC000244]|uniref:hypothetical protein n=1 Tax=Dactylosporangium sp. NPDC000244 TaxID=3154365 RepID=UPI00332BF33F
MTITCPPADRAGLLVEGLRLARGGDIAAAGAVLRRASDDGRAGGVLKHLVKVLAGAGQYAEAIIVALEAARCEDPDPTALTHLGFLLETRGDWHGAALLYREAIDRGDGLARWRLTQAYERRGELDAAVEVAREAADAGDLGPLENLALGREERARDADATALFELAADGYGSRFAGSWLSARREGSGDRRGAVEAARA